MARELSSKCQSEESSSNSHERPQPTWTPVVLRLPFLSALLIFTCALIGLLEFAAHAVPVAKKFTPLATSSADQNSPWALSTSKPVLRRVPQSYSDGLYTNASNTASSITQTASIDSIHHSNVSITFTTPTENSSVYLNPTKTMTPTTTLSSAATSTPISSNLPATTTTSFSPQAIPNPTAYLNPRTTSLPSREATTSATTTLSPTPTLTTTPSELPPATSISYSEAAVTYSSAYLDPTTISYRYATLISEATPIVNTSGSSANTTTTIAAVYLESLTMLNSATSILAVLRTTSAISVTSPASSPEPISLTSEENVVVDVEPAKTSVLLSAAATNYLNPTTTLKTTTTLAATQAAIIIDSVLSNTSSGTPSAVTATVNTLAYLNPSTNSRLSIVATTTVMLVSAAAIDYLNPITISTPTTILVASQEAAANYSALSYTFSSTHLVTPTMSQSAYLSPSTTSELSIAVATTIVPVSAAATDYLIPTTISKSATTLSATQARIAGISVPETISSGSSLISSTLTFDPIAHLNRATTSDLSSAAGTIAAGTIAAGTIAAGTIAAGTIAAGKIATGQPVPTTTSMLVTTSSITQGLLAVGSVTSTSMSGPGRSSVSQTIVHTASPAYFSPGSTSLSSSRSVDGAAVTDATTVVTVGRTAKTTGFSSRSVDGVAVSDANLETTKRRAATTSGSFTRFVGGALVTILTTTITTTWTGITTGSSSRFVGGTAVNEATMKTTKRRAATTFGSFTRFTDGADVADATTIVTVRRTATTSGSSDGTAHGFAPTTATRTATTSRSFTRLVGGAAVPEATTITTKTLIGVSSSLFSSGSTSYPMLLSSSTARLNPSMTYVGFGAVPPLETASSYNATPPADGGVVIIYPWWKSAVAAYVPIALAAIYKSTWTSVFASVKLAEPFVRLAAVGGSLAEDAMFTHYASSNFEIEAIVSFKNGHWVMFWTSMIYSSSGILSPLASEVLRTNTRNCPQGQGGFNLTNANPCFPELTLNSISLRILEGYLVYVVLVMICLLVALRCRRITGLYSNPSSIAGVAVLVHHPSLLRDFRSCLPNESTKSLRRSLQGKVYKLQQYQGVSGTSRYGIVPCDRLSQHDGIGIESPSSVGSLLEEYRQLPGKSWKERVRRIGPDVGFAACLFGLLAVIVAYYLDGGDNGFNRFFNSNTFGPRFILTATGGIIGTQWSCIHKHVQMLDIYRRLSRGNADARRTILYDRSPIPFGSLSSALRHGDWLLALVSAAAILSPVLMIALPGIPYAEGERWVQMLVSTYLSIGILSLMLLTVPILIWWKAKLPVLPREPTTVATIISYVFALRAVQEWGELEFLSTEERNRQIAGSGATWTYGQMDDKLDWTRRWMIDEE